MGLADKVTKDYVSDTDVFADAFNYLLYDGRKVVQPDTLSPVDSSSLLNLLGNTDPVKKNTFVQRYRDILKRAIIQRNDKVTYVLLGIEGQTEIHYAMPVRDMLYDGLQYAEQVNQLKVIHRAKKDDTSSEEFLSGMHADDKLIPVITLVIYFGTKPWDGPRKLSDMLVEMEPEVSKYVRDYELTIIEPYSMNDEDFKKFSTDLGEVLKFLKYAENKVQIRQLLNSENIFQHLNRKAAEVLRTCAGLNLNITTETEVTNMCKAWDDQFQDGVDQGILDNCKKLALKMNKRGDSLSDISDFLEVNEKQVQEWITESACAS